MTEQEFQKEIKDIKITLISIAKNTYHPIWRSFLNGMLSGMGSVLGAALAIAAIGWVLNTIGVIPEFRQQVGEWKQILDNIQRNR